jgi:hypothetical protein
MLHCASLRFLHRPAPPPHPAPLRPRPRANRQTLLWLPERALGAALPAGWREGVDREGLRFYHEGATGLSTYDHPADAQYRELFHELLRRRHSFLSLAPAAPAPQARRARVLRAGRPRVELDKRLARV